MDLSIVLVNWNSLAFLRECLRSVAAQTKGLDYEIIVIDNASYDGCGQMLAKEFPSTVFIQSDKNGGFACANNLAAARARGEVLLFLNPDTELRGPAINMLYAALHARPDAGAVGARLLNTDGTLQTSCLLAFPTLWNEACDTKVLRDRFPQARLWGTAPLYAESAQPQAAEGISGACLLTRRRVFDQVGGFTNDYFMYYEDVDFCQKTAAAGYTNYYVPEAVVVHHGGKSSGGDYSKFSCVMMAESAWRFFHLRHSLGYAVLFRVLISLKAVIFASLLAIGWLLSFLRGGRANVSAAMRKWLVILNWALGRERAWLGRYS